MRCGSWAASCGGTPVLESRVALEEPGGCATLEQLFGTRLAVRCGAEWRELPPEACSRLWLGPGEDPARPTPPGRPREGSFSRNSQKLSLTTVPPAGPRARRTSPPAVHFVDIRFRCGALGLFRVLSFLFFFFVFHKLTFTGDLLGP